MRKFTRRGVLGGVTAGMMTLSGCSKAGRGVRTIARGLRGARESATSDDDGDENESDIDVDGYRGIDEINATDSTVDETLTLTLYQYDGTRSVGAYDYLGWRFPIDPPRVTSEMLTLEYEVVVRSGPAIDVLVLDLEEYEHYRAGNNFLYNRPESELETKHATASVTLEPADYAFVIDNTMAARAGPRHTGDGVSVSIDVSLDGPVGWRPDEDRSE